MSNFAFAGAQEHQQAHEGGRVKGPRGKSFFRIYSECLAVFVLKL
jgi:hypothetical protein